MSAILQECVAALESPNVRAFLRVIREGETSQDESAYRTLVGGGRFESFDDHPRQRIHVRGLNVYSTAAGAYQFLARTWDECRAALALPDFSPQMQDIAAAFLIRRRGALADVLAGNVEQAISKCNREWASLPGSPYGQPTRTMAQAAAVYERWGGTRTANAPSVDTSSQPVGKPSESAHVAPTPIVTEWDLQQPTKEPDMAPLPLLIGLAGDLFSAFSPLLREKATKELSRHTDNPEVAGQVAQTVIGAVQRVTQIADPVAAVAAVKADPALMQRVESSVADELAKLAPMLDRIAAIEQAEHERNEASMDAAAKRAAAEPWDMSKWLVGGAFALMGVLVLFVCGIAAVQAFKSEIKPEVWAQVAGLIGFATGVLVTIYTYRFGTSKSSAAKDVVIEQISRRAVR